MIHLTGIQRLELTRLTRIHQDAIGYVQERAQTRTPTLAQLADILLDDEAGAGLIAPGGAGDDVDLRDDCRKALRFIQGDPELRRLTLAEYRLGWGGDGVAGIALEDEDGERCHFDRNGMAYGEVGYAQGLSARRLRAEKRKRIRATLWFVAAFVAASVVITVLINSMVIDDAKLREEFYAELRVMFKAHLQEKYAGTYYDGEFIVDEKIISGGAPFWIYYGAEAYREDRPDLPFHVRTAIKDREGYITDDFLRKIISWEGARAVADTQIAERIFGKDVLYSGGIGWRDTDIEDRLVKRNGYADMINHYAEDNTYPWINVIVYTKAFDEEEACADIVELYNAMVAGKSEDRFSISVFYTSSDDTKRGLNRGSGSVDAFDRYYNPDFYLAYVDLSYDVKYHGDWRSQYPSLADFAKDYFGQYRNTFEERVIDGYFDR